jgi:hypothetical protein
MLFVSILWNLFLSFLVFSIFVSLVYVLGVGYYKLKLKKPKSLPLRAFSDGGILYTENDWHQDNKKEFPIRYFITETVPGWFQGLWT